MFRSYRSDLRFLINSRNKVVDVVFKRFVVFEIKIAYQQF